MLLMHSTLKWGYASVPTIVITVDPAGWSIDRRVK